ncbi:MAG: ferritin-like domain-containing protein [Polyangiaceae bacterium]|nr:ferritin-like domain-containing protein [Polyangiaceae bacterium]MCW5791474.1 ferritin-like domain-containing protein [Polyangiaceae bacterium]
MVPPEPPPPDSERPILAQQGSEHAGVEPGAAARAEGAEAEGAGGAPEASDRVRSEWLRRVEAEYRSAAVTQHLTLWLIQIGASPDLIAAGLRIVEDELAHAELSYEVYQDAGGTEAPHLVREALGLHRTQTEPLELDVLRSGVDLFCLGETVAVPLFKELREGCHVPSARRALDRVLVDEVRHRDFGWMLAGWLFDSPRREEYRRLVQAELPRMFTRLRRAYAPKGAEAERQIGESERAWGLMPRARYGEILERAVTRDYVPRFEPLGVDALTAWQSELGAQLS